jgi:hypothetical protein
MVQQLSLLARAVLVKMVDHVKMLLLILYVFVQLVVEETRITGENH